MRTRLIVIKKVKEYREKMREREKQIEEIEKKKDSIGEDF